MKKNKSLSTIATMAAAAWLIVLLAGFSYAENIKQMPGKLAKNSVVAHTGGPVEIFSTGGHILYHLQPATVERGQGRVIISAAYDGSVLCHTSKGELRWKSETGGNFPFDLCVADIDGDGLDEVLVASGDGVLYAIGPDGKPLWTFKKKRPLYQVCAARQVDGKCIILTGGVENTLYSLSHKGKLLGKLVLKNYITRIRAGDISRPRLRQGRDMVAVATTTGALAGQLAMHLIDPSDLSIKWTHRELGSYASNTGRRFFSMAILDLDKDGKDDILTSGSWGQHGKIFALNYWGQPMFIQSDPRIPNIPYRMNMLVPVKLPNDEYIIGQFANILIVYNLNGSCREVVTGAYAYSNACFDPITKTLYCGSSVSGGDELVAVHLDQPGWQKAFAEAKPVGKLAKIIANMKVLNKQIADFKRPSYQPQPRRVDVLLQDEYHVRTPEQVRQPYKDGKHVRYVSHLTLCQKMEPGERWCSERSAFGKYNMTADEVVAHAKLWESSGRGFIIQAGHTTALHMSPDTFERVLKAAPKHLWGFEFSEIGQKLDAREQEVVEDVLMTLAEQCRQNGNKKILMRTKNIFWNGNIYHPFFEKVLLDGRYRDIFVPSLEETNSRTQELSLAGRIGLWQSGAVDHWATRAETDNACFNRSWEWSSQQVFSHHMRNLISCASLGSDVYFNAIHQGPFSAELERQIKPFYDMLEKGVVYIPKRSELASISSVAIGMKSPPSKGFLSHGTNGSGYIHPEEQPPFVFDRLDWYWGGAPLEPHDFSRYVFGVQRRMCNFLPLTPYGMVSIVPDKPRPALKGRYTSKISTDGEMFFDAQGKAHGPAEYRKVVETALSAAAKELPVLVRGMAHWSAALIDQKHMRVTLVDPGYLDPDDRDVKIVLQQKGWTRCRDILSNMDLPINDGSIALHIPVGSVRIVDLIQE